MAEEMRNHPYVPVADDDRTFVRQSFPQYGETPLIVGTPFFSEVASMRGYALQGIKVLVVDTAGTATADVELQERVQGIWATKASTGVGTASANVVFDHNSEDRITECRLKITPRSSVPTDSIKVEIVGKRDR